MTVGGISHGFRFIQGFSAYYPTGVVSLEECQVFVACCWVCRGPCHLSIVFVVLHLMGILSVFVHLMVFFVGEQRVGEVIVLGHFTTKEKWRVADSPKTHHAQLLVFCQSGPATFICVGVAWVCDGHGYLTQWEHIAVGIVAWACVLAPYICFVEYGIYRTPVVPEIIHHSPHISIVETFLCILILGFAWAEG